MKNSLIICNFKTFLTFNQIRKWCQVNAPSLGSLAAEHSPQLIFCLPAESLAPNIASLFSLGIELGGQDCSAYPEGAHTGEILANSLKEIGCTYCIIGHDETKKERHLSLHSIKAKYTQAIGAGLIPILCFGETLAEYEAKKTSVIIQDQFESILDWLTTIEPTPNQVILGYEPLWAIGTGSRPSRQEVTEIAQIFSSLFSLKNIRTTARLVYGGSIDIDSVKEYVSIPGLSGIMVGRASTDFQALKKIVSSYSITQ